MYTDGLKLLYQLLVCHFIGDYVLQNDFLAKTKGENWWHLIAHCFLYTVPFALVFGIEWWLIILLASHMIIDALKARWKKMSYLDDQIFHLFFLVYVAVEFIAAK